MRVSKLLLGSMTVLGLTLSGCAAAEPRPITPNPMTRQMRILVNPKNPTAVVMGEIYLQTLRAEGRDAALYRGESATTEMRMKTLASGEADMMIACTGRALSVLDPGKAQELEKKYTALDDQKGKGGSAPLDELEETHMALMAALPPEYTTVDPSSAHGCADQPQQNLPQNIVPIFAKGNLTRQQRFQVSSVTKYLTDADLQELVQESEKSGDPAEVVSHWLATSSTFVGNQKGDSATGDKNQNPADIQTDEGKK